MRFEGRLDKWNDDRGFGFITPTRGGEPVFVHISAFPREGRRPQVGEVLTFEVEPAGDGKKRAVNVERSSASASGHVRPAAGSQPPARRSRRGENRRAFLYIVVAAIVLVVGGAVFYGHFAPAQNVAYRCDGRTYCSQMTSCKEAKFFLKNCPGTKMDGDRDGVPCEEQLCKWWFSP